MTARLRRRWALWRRRATRRDRRWQHYGARCWWGAKARAAAIREARTAMDFNRLRVLESFALARAQVEAYELATRRR